ncbi:hypothetical protein Tco_0667074 [Tanacetum coccineum]
MQYRAVILDLMRRFADVVDVKDIGLGICAHVYSTPLRLHGCIIDFMLLFLQLPVFRRQDAEKVTIVSIGDVHKQQPEVKHHSFQRSELRRLSSELNAAIFFRLQMKNTKNILATYLVISARATPTR